jgi:hypothetical protein
MKLSRTSLSFFFAVVATLSSSTKTNAFVPPILLPSGKSTHIATTTTTTSTSTSTTTTSRLYYDIQRDPPNENVWSVLAHTERWIATTLADAQKENGNPLSRKEVSYVCETSQDPAMILANVFRKLKEARQLGETHAQEQEEIVDEQQQGTTDRRRRHL